MGGTQRVSATALKGDPTTIPSLPMRRHGIHSSNRQFYPVFPPWKYGSREQVDETPSRDGDMEGTLSAMGGCTGRLSICPQVKHQQRISGHQHRGL